MYNKSVLKAGNWPESEEIFRGEVTWIDFNPAPKQRHLETHFLDWLMK